MIALAMIAAHLVGDYVTQTRWQAVGKFGWSAASIRLRASHVAAYTAGFVPVAWASSASLERSLVFLAALAVLHFLTDAQRFERTLGDVVVWRTVRRRKALRFMGPNVRQKVNPWPTLPLAIDQTLHICQLAALGWLLA